MTLFAIELGLLAFWSCWFAIVAMTNAFGALRSRGVLPPSWKFASKNWEAVAKACSIYDSPRWVPAFLFVGVVAWQALTALLYARSLAASLEAGSVAIDAVDAAAGTGLALWAAFMLADEITIKYTYEQPHELLFIAQLATLVALHLLA